MHARGKNIFAIGAVQQSEIPENRCETRAMHICRRRSRDTTQRDGASSAGSSLDGKDDIKFSFVCAGHKNFFGSDDENSHPW